MLPFQKRSVQGQQDDISTEDVVEVVHKVRHAASAALSSRLGSTLRSNEIPGSASSRRHAVDRPRVPAPIPASKRAPASQVASRHVAEQFSEDEDEMTCLMPAKGLIIPPPVSRRAAPQLMSSNTSFRPAPAPRNIHPQSQMYDARSNERRIHRAPPAAVMAARQESAVVPQAPASLAPMAMPLVDSEPHINPGATVVTARTLSRPTASWAAALVAMGIFAGLVTAAVARGDFSPPDQKVAAAAQVAGDQVIPSQPQSQPAASPVMPSSFMPTAAAPMAISAPAQSNPVMGEPVAVAAKFAPTKSAPKASAPAAHVVHQAAPAAEKSEPKVEAKADKSDAKEEKKVASKGKKDKDGDMASAKEAQALADAQLAASL